MLPRKNIFIALTLLMLLMPAAMAHGASEDLVDVGEQFEGRELPGPVKSLFSNERINLHIMEDDGQDILGIVLEDGTFRSIGPVLENPTVRAFTDDETVAAIVASDDPMGAFMEALNSGKIRYEGTDFFSSIKFAVLGFISGLMNLFG